MSLQNEAAKTAPDAAASPRLGVALLIIAAAQLMFTLDDTIVNVARPAMQRSLHVPASSLNWVISFYALAFGGLLLAGGRAGDRFGRLRVFRAGIVVFTLASVTVTLGIGSLIYALSSGNSNGWDNPGPLAAFAAGAALLLAFTLIERGSKAPILPTRVVRDRNRGGANAVLLLLGTGMLAMFYLLTLYLQLVRDYSALRTAHSPAVALTSGYTAGLLAAAVIWAVGAVVGALALNARLTAEEAAGH